MKSFKSSFKVYEDSNQQHQEQQQHQQNTSDQDQTQVNDQDSDLKENMNPEANSVSFPAQLFEIDRRFGTDITELVLRTEGSENNRLNMVGGHTTPLRPPL